MKRRILRAYLKGTRRGALRRFAGWAFDPSLRLRVTRWRIAPPRWTAGPLRIAVLSDIHANAPFVSLANIRRFVRRANALGADIVLLPGDFCYGALPGWERPSRAEVAEELAALHAPLGVFAVMGNHDWQEDDEMEHIASGPPRIARELDRVGIRVLENEALRITRDGGDFWLAGLGDQRAFKKDGEIIGTDDLPATLAQIEDDGAPAILMAHEPDVFVDMDERIALTVSGHTHGGQITLFGKVLGVPSKYGVKYAYGHVRENDCDLIVTSGLGSAVVPLRMGVVPEIAVIELS